MTRCPEPKELVALGDGELIESRARAVNAHAETCARCQSALTDFAELRDDLRSSVSGALAGSPESFADEVVAKLSSRREVSPPLARRRILRWSALLAAACLPIAFALAYRTVKRPEDASWSARGGSSLPSSSRGDPRHTLLRFGRVANGNFEPLDDGSRLRPHDVLCGEVGHTEGPSRYLLAFLVDAAGERHWIYPAYELGAPAPHAFALPSTAGPRVLGSMVRLDGPAVGRARLIAIVLGHDESVAYVESASDGDLSREPLEAHYSDALVTVTQLVVEP